MIDDHKKTSFMLGLFGVGAIVLAIYGQSGIFSSTTKEAAALEELHRVTDAAQIWYVRPNIRGGGGDSFENIDFNRIGLTTTTGAMEWQGTYSSYRIVERNRERFILEVKAPSGQVIALDTLSFDTAPTLNLAHR